MKLLKKILLAGLSVAVMTACGSGEKDSEKTSKVQFPKGEYVKEFDKFYDSYVKFMSEATRNSYAAYFEASVNSTDENWKKQADYDIIINEYLSNSDRFDTLKAFKESGEITDPIKARQLELIYNEFSAKQIDIKLLNELTNMMTTIEGKYSNFRAEYNGKKLSDNEVESILKKSNKNDELKGVWMAQKKIGPLVAQDIINLVKKRNEQAKALGYENFHSMSLILSEEDPAEIEKLFDELDALTRDAFKREKAKMDEILAKKVGIKPEELMPWNYQNRFFQEAPDIYDIDLDKYYKKADIVKITEDYYAQMGLPIEDLVAKSDLFEKPNKNQHAYCINIDRDALDIRVLCNVKKDSKWMETMLHEYGHALYEKHYSKDLPWILKAPAHTLTTEAIAMLFGRKPTNPAWLKDVMKLPDAEIEKIREGVQNTLTLQQLVFSRWSQVMYRFEKALYANPDQDLNKVWWDLVEKYQLIKKPEGRNEPDWATKIHIATSPCYYHNYHLGELFASQLYFKMASIIGAEGTQDLSFYGKKELGKFLIEKVFSVGAKYNWQELVKFATGEPLTAKYYAKQFVK